MDSATNTSCCPASDRISVTPQKFEDGVVQTFAAGSGSMHVKEVR